jgi:hypothetical protein
MKVISETLSDDSVTFHCEVAHTQMTEQRKCIEWIERDALASAVCCAVNLLSENMNNMNKSTEIILNASREIGL